LPCGHKQKYKCMNLQPILEDELVLVRPLKSTDFADLYAVASDPLVWEQHPDFDRYKSDVFESFFEIAMRSGSAFVVIDKSNSKFIGSSRYNRLGEARHAIEIGWTFLARSHWGGRYNGAMKKLMLDHAFGFVDDVIFYIGVDNTRSQKALEKLGGKQVTEPHLQSLIRGDGIDLTYRINKEEWRNHVEKQI
jgi:RimJ/RimL family protein N-acetyltransferase